MHFYGYDASQLPISQYTYDASQLPIRRQYNSFYKYIKYKNKYLELKNQIGGRLVKPGLHLHKGVV